MTAVEVSFIKQSPKGELTIFQDQLLGNTFNSNSYLVTTMYVSGPNSIDQLHHLQSPITSVHLPAIVPWRFPQLKAIFFDGYIPHVSALESFKWIKVYVALRGMRAIEEAQIRFQKFLLTIESFESCTILTIHLNS